MEIVLGATDLGSLLDQIDLHAQLARQSEQIVNEVATMSRKPESSSAEPRGFGTSRRSVPRRSPAKPHAGRLCSRARRPTRSSRRSRGEPEALARLGRVQRQRWEGEASALEAATARIVAVSAAPPASPAAAASAGHGFIWPVRGALVSPFGTRWGQAARRNQNRGSPPDPHRYLGQRHGHLRRLDGRLRPRRRDPAGGRDLDRLRARLEHRRLGRPSRESGTDDRKRRLHRTLLRLACAFRGSASTARLSIR
jgi:hypothetical protein